MPQIPTQLPKEISDRYFIQKNAFRLDKIKNPGLDKMGEVKDNVQIIVGDDKVPDTFIPQVKLCRWANETNFSIRLKDTEIGQEEISSKDNKIKWSKGNIDIEFYDYEENEGGYKLVWYLKEKPLTNKVEFTIQSKGLDFFYQPELTAEEIAQGCVRPENVVGSYAVYHQTKGRINDINGKEYKTGKAFHIYRPHIIDTEGKETWGILHIENGIYSVEIPQDFLDTAVYPIKSNDEFGYHTIGGSYDSGTTGYQFACGPYTGIAGTANTVYFYGGNAATPVSCTMGLYSDTAGEPDVRVGDTDAVNSPVPYGWSAAFTFDASQPVLSAGTTYWIAIGASGGTRVYFDVVDGYSHKRDAETYSAGTLSNPWVTYSTIASRRLSMYVVYTPAAAGSIKTIAGVTWASVKKVSGVAKASIKKIIGVAAS